MHAAAPDAHETEVIPKIEAVAVTRLGDVWLLGDHRLICGDARESETFERLMGDEPARVVFTDPPYNVPVKGHITRRNPKAREFLMAAGEMTPWLDQFVHELMAFPAGRHDDQVDALAHLMTYTQKSLCRAIAPQTAGGRSDFIGFGREAGTAADWTNDPDLSLAYHGPPGEGGPLF